MLCRIDSVDKPLALADGGGQSERLLLTLDERLEVIEDDWLVDGGQVLESQRLEQQGVAAETCGQAGDGRGRTVQRSSDLAVGRTGVEPGGDGCEQLGSFEPVGRGEGGLGESRTATQAAEAGKAAPIGLAGAGAGAGIAKAAWRIETVLRAAPAGAVSGSERARRNSFESEIGPVHEPSNSKARTTQETSSNHVSEAERVRMRTKPLSGYGQNHGPFIAPRWEPSPPNKKKRRHGEP